MLAIIHYLLGLCTESSVPPARVSRLVTAIYDTPRMCGREHCIVKKATRGLINIPRGTDISTISSRDLSSMFAMR